VVQSAGNEDIPATPLAFNATLTLGNKKAVDIVVVRDAGDAATVEVKGRAGKTGWPVDNLGPPRPSHFVVLVCFLGKIADPKQMPEVYVVPSQEIGPLVYHAPGGRKVIPLSRARQVGTAFQHAWQLIAGGTPAPVLPRPDRVAEAGDEGSPA
jgi:hypothetical protein